MGYEIIVEYHNKNKDETSYDINSIETKKIKIGNMTDEIDKTTLAKNLIKQFSRRDVLVSNIKVYEYIKKEIKIKSTNNGVTIGNKKYLFSDVINEDDISTELEIQKQEINNNQLQKTENKNIGKQKKLRNKVIKQVFFNPLEHKLYAMKKKYQKMHVKVGKQYNVIDTFPKQNPREYIIVNDIGENVRLSIDDFEDSDPNEFVAEKEFLPDDNNIIKSNDEINLSGNFIEDKNMPILR